MKEKILYTTSTIYDEQGFSIRQGIKKAQELVRQEEINKKTKQQYDKHKENHRRKKARLKYLLNGKINLKELNN